MNIENKVTITLDKPRTFRLTLKGMLEFEKATGQKMLSGFRLDTLSLEENSTLIWCCLIHEDKELTLEAVQDIVDLSNFAEAMAAVRLCIAGSVYHAKGEKDTLQKKPKQKPRRG